MSIKLILCDFDGTITKCDVLDEICRINGQYYKSREINENFNNGVIDGKTALISRFKLIDGLSVNNIEKNILGNIPLSNGVIDFFNYTEKNNIITLVISGNAEFVLRAFQEKLGFSDFIGSQLNIVDNKISIEKDSDIIAINKYMSAMKYIEKLNCKREEIVAVGDSIGDTCLFELAAYSFLINKKSYLKNTAKEIQSFTEVKEYIESKK